MLDSKSCVGMSNEMVVVVNVPPYMLGTYGDQWAGLSPQQVTHAAEGETDEQIIGRGNSV
jgi:hypothetical protein